MSPQQQPTETPEAELQALIDGTLRRAFPGVKLRHEKQLKLSLGHRSITVDGIAGWALRGRADIIASVGDRALAVVELKRGTLALTDEDRKQLITYAAQLTPRPPLLVLSNGKDVRFFSAHDGEPLQFASVTAKAVRSLFENASRLAAADQAWAMKTLLGTDADAWAGFVRDRTRSVIERLSGSPRDLDRPFITGTLFGRRDAVDIARAFKETNQQVITVTGGPLIGKSNLLRELAERNGDGSSLAILLLRAGDGGAGLFQRLANLFASEFEWPFDEQQARAWVRRLSRSGSPTTLVLAVDDLVPGSKVAADLDELADAGFGPGVRIVATVTDEGPRRSGSGRDATALEQMSITVRLGPLDATEFAAVTGILEMRRILFTLGANFAYEYRLPWVLRAVMAWAAPILEDPLRGVTMAATLGPQLIADGRDRLSRYPEAQRGYRLLALDALKVDDPPSAELSLAESEAFVIRRDALSFNSQSTLPDLLAKGWVSAFRHASGHDVVVPRAPEMFAAELAEAVSDKLEAMLSGDNPVSPRKVGHWLADRLEMQFLGDIVGAQAIGDLGRRTHGFPIGILYGLLDREPEVTPAVGTFGFPQPDGSVFNLRITESGEAFEVDGTGRKISEPFHIELDDRGAVQGSMAGWMILGQLAMWRSESTETGTRVEGRILMRIAACPVPLIRMAGGPHPLLVNDIPGQGSILHDRNGVVEPVTSALQQMFARDWQNLDAWIAEAVEKKSLPLLQRVRISLAAAADACQGDMADWAAVQIAKAVDPAVRSLLGGG